MRRFVIAVLVGLLVAPAPPAATQDAVAQPGTYQGNGDTGGFFNVMPPGQDGVFTSEEIAANQATGEYPDHTVDQTDMYANLVHTAGLRSASQRRLGITDGEIITWFKDGSFGQLGPRARTYSPTEGLTIIRDDRFGVPHIYGDTREAAMFGAGYAVAEDRLFLMDVLRHLGRARLSEFLGASEANKEMDREQLKVAPYREEELTQQVADLCALGEEGARICADAESYTAGVNQYMSEARSDPRKLPGEYVALQQVPQDWKLEDIVAIASLVGGIFGKGGGGEIDSGRFLAQLRAQYSEEEEAQAIFADFRSADDPDAPVTIPERFDYNNHSEIDPASTAILDLEADAEAAEQDAGAPMIADGPLGPINLGGLQGKMSNAIVAAGSSTDGGTPIAVFGPQTGYFTPQLLWEMDIHGPGINARGVAFAGTNLYVQLGRGADYAWSATSAGGDNVDQWVLELCEPDGSEPTRESNAYRHNGECVEMDVYTHRQIAKPSAGGIPDSPSPDNVIFDVEVRRSVYGPVIATGAVDGAPVAVAEQRSTYGAELRSAIGFARINDPDYMAGGVDSFLTAFDGVDFTFNWFYVDREDVAYKHSCLCPIRDPASDPDLPTWGTGEWDWTGEFLAPEQQPQSVNQAFYANWNNKQAPGFRANDSNYSYTSTYRSEFLRKRMAAALRSGRKLTRADMVNIAEDAGTVDLNGQEIYPLALRILDRAGVEIPDNLAPLVEHLRAWTADGGHRRDVDDDGTYDHAVAVSIGDALVEPLLAAVFDDDLRGAEIPERVEDHPRQGLGSAYNGGRMNFLEKDFFQVLGREVAAPRSRTYCGDGTAEGCAERILEALGVAREKLVTQYESDDPETWAYDKTLDFIIQSPVGVVAAPPMEWVNRPTFQQVVQSGSRTGRIDPGGAAATARALSRQAFARGADTVVITDRQWQSAMAATPLAVQRSAPILIAERGGLARRTLFEIRRLNATRAVLVGDEERVPARVEEQLAALNINEITRIDRSSRSGIAAGTARRLEGRPTSVVIAPAKGWRESLTIGAYAARTDRAVLLAGRRTLPKATRNALADVEAAVIVGSTQVISRRVAEALREEGVTVRRLAGATPDGTNRKVLRDLRSSSGQIRDVYVVARASQALAAGAAAGVRMGVVAPLQEGRLARSGRVRSYLSNRAPAILRQWIVDNQRRISSDERGGLEATIAR